MARPWCFLPLSSTVRSRHGGIVSRGAAKVSPPVEPRDRRPRAPAPPAPPPPRLPRGGRCAVTGSPAHRDRHAVLGGCWLRPAGPLRVAGEQRSTCRRCAAVPGARRGRGARRRGVTFPAGCGARGSPGRLCSLGGLGAVWVRCPAGRSAERRGASRARCLRRAGRRGALGNGPERFPAAGAGRSAPGGGRALQRGAGWAAADHAFIPPAVGRAAAWESAGLAGGGVLGGENKGPPAGAGRELRCCAWGASSQNRGGRGVRPPGGSRLQPPRSQLLPRSRSRNLLGRLPGREPRGEPAEAGGSPPRDARGCRAGVEGAGVGAGSLRRAGVEAGGECCTRVCFPSWRFRHPETVLRPNFKQFKYLA